MAATRVDMSDPNVKRLVYTMYRGMLGGYNTQANGIINTMPRAAVKEDQGIQRQIESMMRQSSQLSGGGSPSPGIPADGAPVNVAPTFAAAPPPPPPPVPGALGLPTSRITTEIPDTRGRGGVKEPPAAVLNAMMSKDKKPFTYTPGGIDLSQIRSPRMQRRIERNAAAEGVPEQPKQQPSASTLSPSSASPMSHPQIAVPVFPPAPPPPPPPPGVMSSSRPAAVGGASSAPPPQQYGGGVIGGVAGHPQIVIPKNPVLRPTGLRHDKSEQETYAQQQQQNPPPQREPSVNMHVQQQRQEVQQPPPGATMYVQQQRQEVQQSPTATMYAPRPPNNNTLYENSPPTKRPSPPREAASAASVVSRAQLGSLYIPPISAETVTGASPQTGSPVQLNKAPTPWMSQQKPPPPVPTWAAREDGAATPSRVIPIQIEGREPSQQQQQYQQQQQQYQQQQQQQQYQQQQYQQQQQQQQQYQQQQQQREQQQSPGTRIIPIQIEGAAPPPQQPAPHRGQRIVQPVYQHNKFNPTQQQGYQPQQQQQDSASDPRQQSWSGVPVQSRAFQVLQKMTDTADPGEQVEGDGRQYQPAKAQWVPGQQEYPGGPQNTQGAPPVGQLRKLQLNDDDRALMNKFKAQVSENNPANEEENPRYRGGHIPSRVFRMLDQSVPRGPTPGTQNRPQQSQVDAPSGPYIPASQQQVQEPRKYTGGAIPSRSFRMLQAMTAPENCGPDQSDM